MITLCYCRFPVFVVAAALALPVFGLSVERVQAQDTTGTGTLSGVVSDNRGAPEPFTTVCVADSSRCVVAGEDGTFRLDGLRVGAYRLQITAPGRPAILSDAIEVRAGIDQRVEVTAPQLDVLQNSITVVGTASTTMMRVTLAAISFWRWMSERDDSRWYPTARLFRQDTLGDWPPVIQRVVDALGRLESLPPVPQPEAGANYASKIEKAEGAVDWTLPAAAVRATSGSTVSRQKARLASA